MYNAARTLQGRARNKEYQLHRNQAEKHTRENTRNVQDIPELKYTFLDIIRYLRHLRLLADVKMCHNIRKLTYTV